jgi:LPXTG-motif cell wall-anchored protein
LPRTGFGGEAIAHNVAIGKVFRAAHGNVVLGITSQPQTGGGSSPLNPVILGAIVVALGVLTRRFAYVRQ